MKIFVSFVRSIYFQVEKIIFPFKQKRIDLEEGEGGGRRLRQVFEPLLTQRFHLLFWDI